MERILIIGGNGSGKTTFSRRLAEKTGLPLLHLDRLYWKGNWDHTTDKEFDALLLPELEKSRWIIDGNYRRTLPLRLAYCDTVVYFDFPRHTCLWGVLTRVLKHYGTCRPDMGGNCPDRFDPAFLKDVWKFNKVQRPFYHTQLNAAENVTVHTFHRCRDAWRWLDSL